MRTKKSLKHHLQKAIFGCFFALITLFGGIFAATPVFAIPEANTEAPIETTTTDTTAPDAATNSGTDDCKSQLGAIGWLVCPTTGKIAEAVDWLYDKIESILVINPISTEDGSPIYEIWKYCRGVTNIVFIIFLLIIVYSQITGLGINNYGIKKSLPKLIIAAILVNLSFLICSLAVDVSNIVGQSLRGVFTSVEEASITASAGSLPKVSFAGLFGSLAGGTALAIGAGVIAFETGAIWMLIPVVLGAIVAVASGLITIALRQAVVALLIMISPLAFVTYILPNTEDLFKKWKKLLTRMLVFYPAFSLLFGASHLAGWAIIASAKDGFAILLGVAVQIFPLFFSWSLMKMSGTLLGTINDKMRGFAAKPLATNRAWADSHRQLTKQKYLASEKARTPSLRLTQFIANRRIARDAETSEAAEVSKNRGLAYAANRHYRKDGTISRTGERAYGRQTTNLKYQRAIARDKNNFNRGLADLKDLDGRKSYRNDKQLRRLNALDAEIVEASDSYKYELARGEKIEYNNATSFYERTESAISSHTGSKMLGALNADDVRRYQTMNRIMEGNALDIHFVAADAAYSYDAQVKVVSSKFSKYLDLVPPTQELVNRLNELAKSPDSTKYIDPIISGMSVLCRRGDTDLVKDAMDNLLTNITGDGTAESKIQLGSHASQSLASFLMFDVGNKDPMLRRYGKYINLETARVFNESSNPRHNRDLTFDEYLTGEYVETDENGNILHDDKGNIVYGHAKRPATVLLKGTSFKDIERTALANLTASIKKTCTGPDGQVDQDKFEKLQNAIDDSIFANLIGDSLQYLSGSEQVTSLANYLTGFKDDGTGKMVADWDKKDADGNFKKTAEERDRERDFHIKRTTKFINGHVPSQIGRFKTDIFAAVEALFGDQARADSDVEGESKDYYDNLTEEKDGVMGGKERFRKAIKPDTYERLKVMAKKGYLSDAKSPILTYLGLDRKPTDNDNLDDDPNLPETPFNPSSLDANTIQYLDGSIRNIYQTTKDSTAEEYYNEVCDLLSPDARFDDLLRGFVEHHRSHKNASRAELHAFLMKNLK